MKILVVDDNESSLYQLQFLLSASGHEVTTAPNGAEALAKAREHPPDIIITDILMPVLDGYSLCRAWMRDEQLREIPLVFYTATYTDDRDREFALSLGARAFIVKPEEPDVFLARLSEIMGQVTEEPLAPPPTGPPPEPTAEAAVAEEEATYLRQYNEVLIRKLEDKVRQLEDAFADLQRERDLIAKIADVSPVGIAVVAPDGQITFANTEAEQVLGLQRDEITSRAYNAPTWRITAFDGSPFPDEELPFARVRDTLGPVRDVEHAIEHPDGTRVFLRINGEPLLDENGELLCAVMAFRDVTRRVRLQATLRESERRFRETMENVRLVSVMLDANGNVTFCNRALCELTGYREEEIVGRNWFTAQFLPEDVIQHLYPLFLEAIAAAEFPLVHHENPIMTRTGERREILWSNILLRDTAGNAIGTASIGEDVTDRNRALEELDKARQEWERIFQAIAHPAFILDPEHKIMAVNAAAVAKFGEPADALVGRYCYEIVHGSNAPPDACPMQAALLSGGAETREMEMDAEVNGNVFLVSCTPVLGESGAIERIIHIATDVTARRRAQERQALALRVLERLNSGGPPYDMVREITLMLRDSLDIQAIALRLRDVEQYAYYTASGFPGGFIETESCICEMAADGTWRRDEQRRPILACMCGVVLRGDTDPSLPFFTDAGSFWANSLGERLAAAAETERFGPLRDWFYDAGFESVALIPLRVGDEIVGLLQLNDPRPNRFSLDTIQFLEGLSASLAIAVTNARLREERDQLARAVEQSGEMVLVYTRDGAIAYANKACETITGYSRSELVGRRMFRSLARDARLLVSEALRNQVAMGRIWAGSLTIKRRDGSDCELDVVFSPVLGPDGEMAELIVTGRDVTAMSALGAQLAQAQKLESIAMLAGGVAHDFNNILTVIGGQAEMLLAELPPAGTARDRAMAISDAGVRASSLTRQLLAFSRRQVLRPRVLDVNAHISDVAQMLRRLIPANIDLVTALSPGLWEVLADPGQLEQVIINLVVNARDAMPDGGKLTLQTCNVNLDRAYANSRIGVEPGDYVQISITDTGIGMDASTLERMFEPFFTTKPEGRGTGLGLSTVYGIVKQSRGHIWAYSEPGRGTTLRIYLPRHLDGGVTAAAETSTPQSHLLRKATVLVAEDDSQVRTIIEEALTSRGCIVLSAGDGLEAIAVAADQAESIELLITDIVMPRMGGLDLLRRLRELGADCKVIYMSGYADADATASIPSEAPLLQKPFSVEELVRTVRSTLS